MHSLSPQFSGHDHGASLDAASYGLLNEAAASEAASSGSNQRLHHISSSSSSSSTSEQHHFVHGLLEAVQHHVNTAVHHQQDHHTSPEAIMPAASNLAELKSRLCLREGLDHDECERAMLPTLEHASLVHSHIHHLTDQSDEAFAQTRNAIVYISLVVVIYVIVVLWLVSANFRSTLTSLTPRNVVNHMIGPHIRDDGELESLIVVRDKGDKKKQKAQCTTELDHEDDGDYV